MAFVKLVKNNAYFKRYQTKYRRRREGKTDYRARKRLVAQAKNKFNTPKYRMVVRISNRYVYCQIAWATIQGDKILCCANSKELADKYGMPGYFGLKNWTACYATGLLLARRVLKKLKLDDIYEGQTENDGEDYLVEEVEGKPKPFRVCLDVGLQTTSTGARIFGALKGALDGGLQIPHSVRRWPAAEKDQVESELLQKYIYGGHVGEYMEAMNEDDEELYKTHFKKYLDNDVDADSMEDTWKAVYEKIREAPELVKTAKKVPAKKRNKKLRLNAAQRKNRVAQKMASFAAKQAAE